MVERSPACFGRGLVVVRVAWRLPADSFFAIEKHERTAAVVRENWLRGAAERGGADGVAHQHGDGERANAAGRLGVIAPATSATSG